MNLIDFSRRGVGTPAPFFLFLLLILFFLISFSSCSHKSEKVSDVDICNNLDSLNSAIARDSTNGQLYSCRAKLLYDKGDFLKSLYDISMALHLNGNNTPDLLLQSDIYFVMKDADLAQKSLMTALSLDENDYSVYYALGKHFYLLKNYELSKGYLNKSIQLQPVNPYSLCLLGEINLADSDTNAAINNFHRAIQVEKNYYPAYMQLATVSLIQNSSLTPQYLQDAININHESCDAIYMMGVYYQQNKFYRKAINYYTQVFIKRPDYKMASYNAGYIYLVELNVFDTAVVWFNRAIAVDTTFYDAYYNRAYALQLEGKISAAQTEYKKLLAKKPDYSLARKRLNEIGK